MKIKQLLIQPIGQKIGGGFTLTIKTAKKKWQVDNNWMQQVILMDETGEIPADVNIGKLIPLVAGSRIRTIVSEVQEAEYLGKDRRKLYIDQYSLPATIGEPPQDDFYGDTKVIRGKVKCWLVAAKIQSGSQTVEVLAFAKDARLAAIIDSIMEG